MAVLAVGLIVGGMVLALAPANETFTRLDRQLIPARNEIDTASASYAETARTLQRAAVETDPAREVRRVRVSWRRRTPPARPHGSRSSASR